MIPLVVLAGLGLASVVFLSGCEASSPPHSLGENASSSNDNLPLIEPAGRSREIYRQILSTGVSSRRLDRGYFVSPLTTYFQSSSDQAGVGAGDGLLHPVEVYLGSLDLWESDPTHEGYNQVLQNVYSDPGTRMDFAFALTHSPGNRNERLETAQNIIQDFTGREGVAPGLWFVLGDIQQMRGNYDQAEESYREALIRQDGYRRYATLMRLSNLMVRQGREREAHRYQQRAWELGQE